MTYQVKGSMSVSNQLTALAGRQTNIYIVDAAVDFTTAEPGHVAGALYVNTVTGLGSITVAQTFTINRLYRSNGTVWSELIQTEGWMVVDRAANQVRFFDGATYIPLGTADDLISPDTLTYIEATNPALTFTVEGNSAGSITWDSGLGMPKWTINGILDPSAYAGTPQTIAQRNALVVTSPLTKAGWLVYVVDVGVAEYQVWTGSAWATVGTPSLFMGVSASTAVVGALPKATLLEGQTWIVGQDIYTWRAAATSGAFQPADTAFPGLDAGWWVKIATQYAGAYSASAAYTASDLVLHNGALYYAYVGRDQGVWGASPPTAQFIQVPGIVRAQFDGNQDYAIGDLVYDGTNQIGLREGIYRMVAAHVGGAFPNVEAVTPVAERSVYRGQYGAGVYKVGDVVEQAGSLYRCIVAHGLNGFAGPFTPANWTGISGNIYTADGTITDGVRTVDLDGNDLNFNIGATTVATLTDGVAGAKLDYIPEVHTFATGVNFAPNSAYQMHMLIASVASTGNCLVDNFAFGSVNAEAVFHIENSDPLSRTFVFNTGYKGFDGTTDFGSIVVATNVDRFIRFRKASGSTNWTLVEDTAGFTGSNIYGSSGSLTSTRTVTLAGNDLTFAGSTGSAIIEDTGKLSVNDFRWDHNETTYFVNNAVIAVTPERAQTAVLDANSTGAILVSPPSIVSGPSSAYVKLAIVNTDVAAKTVTFGPAYFGMDGTTALSAVVIPAGTVRQFEFHYSSLDTFFTHRWVLVSDTGGIQTSAGITQWATATAYAVDQYVEEGFKLWRCIVAHTSGTFSVDQTANWVEVSRAFDDWEFAANNAVALVLSSYILTPGNTINMPVAPADGDAVRFATLTEWAAANITFTAPGATTVAAGQTGILAGYDVIEMVYDAGNDNWVALLGGAAAPDIAAPLDASAGVLALTLPAATGSGTIKRYVVKDITNTITFGVQVGESINEVLNETYTASNHGLGTFLEAVDYATGKWSLQVVGAPTSLTLARYSVRGVVDNFDTVNGANILPIGSLITSDLSSSGQHQAFEHDPLGWRAGNQITVSKTGLYRVDLNVVHTSSALVGANAQVASGSSRSGIRINGTSIEWLGVDDSSGLADQTSGFIIRQFTAGDEIDVVVNATSIETSEDFYVSFAMEELPSTETILAGHVVPTPLHKYSAAMTAGLATVSSTTLPLSATQLDSKLDPHGMGVGNTVVIQQSGLYRVDFSSLMSGNNVVSLRVNGVSKAAGFLTATSTSAIQWAGNLVVGDVITLTSGSATTWTTVSLVVQQLPISTVVNPDTVPVNPLANSVRVVPTAASATGASFAVLTGCTYTVTASMAGRVRVDMHVGFTNASDDDRYPVAAIHKNGVIVSESLGNAWVKQTLNYIEAIDTNCELTVIAGDVLDLRVRHAGGSGTVTASGAPQDGSTVGTFSYFTVTPVPSYSVVKYNPGDVTAIALTSGQTADAAITTGQTTTSTAFVDVTGASVTLPQAGTYEIEYVIPVNHGTVGAAVTTVLTDSLNNPIIGTYCEMAEASGGGVTGPSRGRATVTVTTSATYKVRWRVGSGTGTIFNTAAGGGSAWVRYQQLPTHEVVQPGSATVQTWTGYVPAITGTSNPTKGAVASDFAQYHVVGKVMHLNYTYTQTSGGSAGSGVYRISMPIGYTIDMTKLTGNQTPAVSEGGTVIGTGRCSAAGSQHMAAFYAYDANNFAVGFVQMATGGTSNWGSTAPLSVAQVYVSGSLTIPIV